MLLARALSFVVSQIGRLLSSSVYRGCPDSHNALVDAFVHGGGPVIPGKFIVRVLTSVRRESGFHALTLARRQDDC